MITLFIDLTLFNKKRWIALCVYVCIEKYLSITARNCVTAKYLYNLNCWLLLWLVIKFTVHYFLHSAMQRAIVFKDKKDHKFTYINCKSRYFRKEERTVLFTCFTHIINETERKIFISSLAVSTGVQIARYATMEYYCKIEYRSSALLSHRDAWLLETPLCCIGYKKKKKNIDATFSHFRLRATFDFNVSQCKIRFRAITIDTCRHTIIFDYFSRCLAKYNDTTLRAIAISESVFEIVCEGGGGVIKNIKKNVSCFYRNRDFFSIFLLYLFT